MSGNAPLVSVVIPTYRHRDLVPATLASVWAQTCTDTEVIVVDDGSPDDTAGALRPLAEAGRIRYFRQENAGQARARNRGIAEARGTFIALLDDDDLWPPDKLEWQVAALRERPDAVLAYGFAARLSDDLRLSEPDMPSGPVREAFLRRNYIFSPGQTLIRSDALRQVGGCDASIWGSDDWDLYIRLAALGPFVYQDRNALRYRLHAGNASKNAWKMYVNACRVQRKHLGLLPRPGRFGAWRDCRAFLRGLYSGELIRAADRHREAGEMGEARRMWLRALWINPALLTLPWALKTLAGCLLRTGGAANRG